MHDILRGKLAYANIVLCLFVSLFFNAVIINFIVVVIIIIDVTTIIIIIFTPMIKDNICMNRLLHLKCGRETKDHKS